MHKWSVEKSSTRQIDAKVGEDSKWQACTDVHVQEQQKMNKMATANVGKVITADNQRVSLVSHHKTKRNANGAKFKYTSSLGFI